MARVKKLEYGWQYRISYVVDGKWKIERHNGFKTKNEALTAALFREKDLGLR
ncbi:Arm DNA-binding domain-containing protein [Shouchella lonarensis]|uniref:AP2-like DNA-binding integrase domain-containing protein n=1 Tax=Shouchella lonarensis TaxID=1464122 RepID=A0A1G6HSB1_9BACI|nr:Arm DNA-binding domain-containing protein [Shouchella lonarensis]SDB97090.1 AP2-like DNA-binding integrase domain-containing protein [Shouchella lonarensis]